MICTPITAAHHSVIGKIYRKYETGQALVSVVKSSSLNQILRKVMYSASVDDWVYVIGSRGGAAIHLVKVVFSRQSHLNQSLSGKYLPINGVYNGGLHFTNEYAEAFEPAPFHRTIPTRMPSALLAIQPAEPWIQSRLERMHRFQTI
jgi:hypothetical protein